MSTLKNIVSGTSALAASNVIARAASFVSVVITTTMLSLHDYGLLTLAVALSGPILSFCNLGMDELISADVSRFLGEEKKSRAKRLLLSYFRMQWSIVPILIIVLFFAKALLVGRYGALIETSFFPLMGFVLIQLARTGIITFLTIHTRFVEIAKFQAAEPIIRCLMMVMLWILGHVSVTTVLWGYVCAGLLSIGTVLPAVTVLIKRYQAMSTSHEPILRWTLRSHGKWQGFLVIMTSITNSLRYYFINHIISTEAVAIFSVAQSMYSVVTSLLPLKTVVGPLIARRVHDDYLIRAFIAKAAKYTFLLYFLVMVGVMIGAPVLITFFFPKYTASIIVFEFMLLRLPFNMFSLVHGALMIAYRNQRILSIIAIFNFGMLFFVTPFFLKTFGVLGTVGESLFTVFVILVMREWYLRKYHHIAAWDARAFVTFDARDREVLDELFVWGKRMFKKLSRASR